MIVVRMIVVLLFVFKGARINPKLAVTHDSSQEFLFAKPPSPPSLAEDIGEA